MKSLTNKRGSHFIIPGWFRALGLWTGDQLTRNITTHGKVLVEAITFFGLKKIEDANFEFNLGNRK